MHPIALPFKLLSKREHSLLILVVFITFFLAVLDLFGVLLIGIIGSLSITGIGSAQIGDRVSVVLETLRLDALEFESQIIILGLLSAGLLITKTLLSLILLKKTMFFLARRAAAMSSVLVKKYFTISVARVNKRSLQNSIYSLTDGVSKIMIGVVGVSISLVSDLALLIVLGAGLLIVDPIAAVGTGLLFGLLAHLLYSSMHRRMQELSKQQGLMSIESSQKIYEAITSYRELIVRNRRNFYANEISDLRYKIADGKATINFMGTLTKYTLEISLVVGSVLLAAYQFSTSTAFRAIATITVFIAASARITPAILRLQHGILGIKGALAEARPTTLLIEELSDISPEDQHFAGLARTHPDFQAKVKISGVTFSYDGVLKILTNVNLQANPGELVAIVGESGAGKTTLLDVVLGALDAQSGSIEISGMQPRQTFSRWPGAVAYVSQDSPVINGSIRENLGLGFSIEEITDEFCWESLRIAKLESFVRSLPKQLDSYVGDRGTLLSGGQKQRLGIARALVTKPKLLILDEATSSLDSATEADVSEALRAMKGDVTLMIVAHRLSTVISADRIYFMGDGMVKGVGTFQELKENNLEFFRQAELMGL